MGTHKLHNYLRTYRKRSGLTQREVAFLLGCDSGTQVSRYEKRHRLPPLRTALACEVILGVPLGSLFGGIREDVHREIKERLKELRSRLRSPSVRLSPSKARALEYKLQWLDSQNEIPQRPN